MNQPRDRKDALLEAGLTLASELSLPIVLQRIVDLAVQVTDARYGALGVTEKRSAREFSAEDEVSLIVLATQAGAAIANASLYEEMRARERWLDALHEITSEILAGADADAVLPRIAEDARSLANAETAIVVNTSAVP